ncbi:putative lipoprotein [Prevotella sp. CAG:279]|nr:putative lipoprotein [Prevotella sp. CAG:279]
MRNKLILSLLCAAVLTGCGEYNKVLKSSDTNYKYEYAKKAFEERKYVQAATLLEDVVKVLKGTDKAEESLYLLGLSHYENKDYASASTYFQTYYTHYPKGKYTELARFYAGYGYYLDSPEPQLDQTDTYKAIDELQRFLDYFPNSDKKSIAQSAIFELQDKLVQKEIDNAQLYYNLGNYLGNNYESAVIVATNALKNYPYTKHKEQLQMIVLKSKFQQAYQSVIEKKADRYREVIDEYYSFINDYPESKYRSEADNIFKIANNYLNK